MEKLFGKLDEDDMKEVLMKHADGSNSRTRQQPPRPELLPVDLKFGEPATYMSLSRRITCPLAETGLEGYLTREEKELDDNENVKWKAWRATHMSLYTWLLNSMVSSRATTVDGIQNVKGMRVFLLIEQEVDVVFQEDRSVQEYTIELEHLCTDYDHFSPLTACEDPERKNMEVYAQRKTMLCLKHLNPRLHNAVA